MTRSILITVDAAMSLRWAEVFPDADCVSAPDLALTLVDSDSIIWLHLRRDSADARETVAIAARLLAPARIVALSDTPMDEEALELLEAGAVGYCHSHAAGPTLKQVETVVANDGLWVGPGLLKRLIGTAPKLLPATTPGTASLCSLSPREREVASLAGRGDSNREIAMELGITERTVKAHLSAVFAKLAVRDRLHLALLMRGPATG